MLNLSELKFNVNTEALVNAKKAIDALAAAQANLNKTTQSGGGSGGGGDAPQKQTKTQIDLLKKLQELYGDLANGATRWEATQLRAARSMGLPLTEVEEQLKNIRKLTKDPFDSAIGSVRSVTQHFEELQNRIKLTNDGLILTTKQLREYSRISFEVEGKLKAQGVDTISVDGSSQLLSQIAKEEAAYISKAVAVNKLADAERERINTSKAALQADKFLATEMQRVDSVLNELNREHAEGSILSEKHANSVSRFANQLKAAGVSGTAAAAQLEQYRGKMQQIEAIENRRAQNRLANALAPQISDVAVSIAGGMPLHLVIMQQGLQIRDLIGQSGVAAEHLQKTMRDAMKNMVTSIGGTIAALGTMTFGALADAGNAVVEFGHKVVGAKSAMNGMKTEMALAILAHDEFTQAQIKSARATQMMLSAIVGVGIGAFVAVLGAATYEFIKLIGANNDLVRELAVTGNVFGVTTTSSLQYVEGLTKVGATTREAISIIGEMSKAGNLSRTQIELVGKAAVDMERAAGVAIEDTVKRFSDLAKDPIKALSTLQIQTGAVQPEIIKLVDELTKQGNAAKASGVAVEELARIMGVQTSKMVEDLHPLTRAFNGLVWLMKEAYSDLGNLINRAMGSLPKQQKLFESIKDRQREINSLVGASGRDGMHKGRIAALELEQQEELKRLKILRDGDDAEKKRAADRVDAEKRRTKANELDLKYLDSAKRKTNELAQLEKDRKFLAAEGKPMTDAAYNEAKKKILDGGKSSGSGGGRQVTYEIGLYEKLNDAYIKVATNSQNYNDIQKALLDIFDDPRFANMTDAEKRGLVKHAEELLNAAAGAESLAEAEKNATKAHEDYVKAQAEGIKQMEDSAKSAEDRLLAMQEEAKATELAETLQISLAQAIEMTAIARLREQQAMEMSTGVGDPKVLSALTREIEARQKIIAELGKKDSKEVAKDYSDNLQKEFEAMRDGIADSITTALFEGGKAGSQKIRQVIVDALKKPIVATVQAVVNTLIGSVLGGGGQGGGLSSLLSGGSGGLGGLVDGLSNLYNVGKSFLNGSKIMSEAVGGWTRAADWAATSSNSSVAGVGNWMQSNPMVGNMLGMAGNAFAGYGIGKALSGTISNGYSVGKGYNQFQEIGMAVASAFGGPVFGAIIGAATGAINRLFGRKLKDAGIEGTFSGADQFSGNSYEFYKGGLFRSDKTKRNPLDQATTDALGEAFKAVRDGVLDMSGALGLGAEALDGYTKSIKFSTKGMNEQQIQEAWAKEFTAISEEMAQRFMGTFETTISRGNWFTSIRGLPGRITTEWKPGEFVREGETALQALTRLSTAIKVVNPMLEVLKLSMYDVSLAGGDMASKLVDLFGNAETMLGLTTAYYQNYYSEAERTAEATKQMTNALAELGINTLPMSRDAYRDLVESQDLTTEAGRKMFAELMKLAPAFSELTTAMSEVTNGVIDEVRRLRGEIYGSSAATLEAQFAIATAAARAGDSNAMAQLPALSQALEATARLNAVTAADLAISRARLAASLTETLATQGTAIPAFAGGGMYRGGLALVGERGPELINFNRGGRVHNNNETVQMLNNSSNGTATVIAAAMRQVAAVKEVNTEINMMRAETKSTAINMSKLIRLLERVTRDGESLQVTNV